jgi:hypothetical protein
MGKLVGGVQLAHEPFVQGWPAGHTTPQLPQLF